MAFSIITMFASHYLCLIGIFITSGRNRISIEQSLLFSLSLAPDNHESAFCLSGFVYSGFSCK